LSTGKFLTPDSKGSAREPLSRTGDKRIEGGQKLGGTLIRQKKPGSPGAAESAEAVEEGTGMEGGEPSRVKPLPGVLPRGMQRAVLRGKGDGHPVRRPTQGTPLHKRTVEKGLTRS